MRTILNTYQRFELRTTNVTCMFVLLSILMWLIFHFINVDFCILVRCGIRPALLALPSYLISAYRSFGATSIKELLVWYRITQIWLQKILTQTSRRLICHLHAILEHSYWKLKQTTTNNSVRKFMITVGANIKKISTLYLSLFKSFMNVKLDQVCCLLCQKGNLWATT